MRITVNGEGRELETPLTVSGLLAELGLDDFLCTRFAVRDGVFTGEVDGTLCYGPGKLVQATEYTRARGVQLEDCSFYTDSYSDLPVLEAVGTPIAAHPDPRLLRHAKKSDWSIVDWGPQ